MKREIKFRAYRKSTQNTCDVLSIDFENESVLLSDGDEEDIPTVELMQYTNLKDKNGREIYEGDLVKNENGALRVVEFHDGSFTLGDYYFGSIGAGRVLEVIGNIYENPDLLEAQHD